MNTNALKKFAQEARRKLVEQVGSKLEYVLNTDTPELREKVDQINKLKEAIQSTSKEQVIDKVTYTWFNRFMALRFMDANDYQPIGIRVLTPKDGYTLPELLDEAKQGNIPEELKVKNQRIYDLLDGKIPSSNAQNEAYKELLIGACNHLNKVLPFLFERINDYTELLLPDDLTSELSIVQDIRDGMTIEDCAEVEVIGWLYQFYISEKKDEVFASKAAVKKEDIPAATQLFTPRWIVAYMVQNTVGKLWLQNNPNSKLREHMPYFIESPSVTADNYLKISSVEEITLLDQACGSGHILVYGFELLSKIYEEEGYNPNEIPELIITKNLFGFEIDERASQLAGMALMMKARSYNRRFFKKEVEPTILCYKDLVLTNEEIKEAFEQIEFKPSDDLNFDLQTMQQATNFGSLMVPNATRNEIEKAFEMVKYRVNTSDAFLSYKLENLKTALGQLLLLSHKYHCIVDNPPYMGGGNMNKILGDFVKKKYPDSKADLMACFMEAGLNMLQPRGYLAMINQQTWMFISSYINLRHKIINNFQIESLLQIGFNSFPELNSKLSLATAFILKNQKSLEQGVYFNLNDTIESADKKSYFEEKFLKKDFFSMNQTSFLKISGFPIAYWLSDIAIKNFQDKTLSNYAHSFQGIISGNNTRLLRRWSELPTKRTTYNFKDFKESIGIDTYVPYQKGGEYRKWYGNNEFVIHWNGNGKHLTRARTENTNYYFKSCISWTFLCLNISARKIPFGHLWDVAGSSAFSNSPENENGLLALLSCKLGGVILDVLNPTLNYQVENIMAIPIKEGVFSADISKIVNVLVQYSTIEWDSKETSWDFNLNELIKHKSQDLEEAYDLYQQFWKNKFFQLHKNEEELNRQFIEIYGLQEELTPDVPLKDITILKEETFIENGQLVFKQTEVFAQFMSYAVGCMFGRYSLDKEGLILANQGETLEDYLVKVELPKDRLSFMPDDDNIIPVLDDEWFEDDITGRFYAFLKASFGKENFDKNLAFVEECLGKDVRKYFVKDFYNDHIKRYKKRPIYWMFSSPKGAFNVLIYMHRYTPDTLNKILNGYLIQYREKLNTHLEHLVHLTVSGTSIEQTKAIKETEKLKLVLLELKEYERDILYPMATDRERLSINLDDGVLVNYNKFGKAIKEVKGLNDKVTKKKVSGFDWIDATTIR